MAPAQRHALLLLLTVTTLVLGITVSQALVALPVTPFPTTATATGPGYGEPLLRTLAGAHDEEEPRHHASAPTPAVAAVPAAARKPVPPPRERRVTATRSRHLPHLSFEEEVRRQVARIPMYRPGLVKWVVWPGLRSYGLTERYTGTVYLSPRIPRRLLYSVVVHEWGHVISTYGYGRDLRAADDAVLRWFGGGSPTVAIERAADCVARLLGARWTHYTSCANERWRLGARYLFVGWKLPTQD